LIKIGKKEQKAMEIYRKTRNKTKKNGKARQQTREEKKYTIYERKNKSNKEIRTGKEKGSMKVK
jgi:hypothetical protein